MFRVWVRGLVTGEKYSRVREIVFLTRELNSLAREKVSLIREVRSLTWERLFPTWKNIFLTGERFFRVGKGRFETRERVSRTREIIFRVWPRGGRMPIGAVNVNLQPRQDVMPNYDTPGLSYDSGAFYDDVAPLPSTFNKKMAKVTFSLKAVPDPGVIQECTNLKTALTGNANFPTLPVSLATFGTKITSAQAKLTASDNAAALSKQATADKDTEIAALIAMAMQLVGYVDLTANGDESKILSAGLSVRSARVPQSVPVQVQNLALTTGDNTGEIDAQWDGISNAKSFEVQTSPDPFTDASWRTADTVTNSKVALTGLTSGAKIWVRVRDVNSKGKGPWSDPSVKVVP